MKTIIPVILAGEVRPSLLRRQTGLLPLEIPLRPGWTNLDAWLECLHASPVEHRGTVLVSSANELHRLRNQRVRRDLDLMVDQRTHRGTGGILADFRLGHRDVAAKDAAFLMIEGNCVPPGDLGPLIDDFHRRQAAIAFGTFSSDRLRGVCLIDESVLNLVPPVGFFDLKEQLVMATRDAGGVVIGTNLNDPLIRLTRLPQLLQAVSRFAVDEVGGSDQSVAMIAGENCIHDFGGIAPRAGVVSSVLMPGVEIGPEAVIARSFIGSGVRIPAGRRVIDAVLPSKDVPKILQNGSGA